MPYQLAQVNIARLLAPLDSHQLADFVARLDPVNASADVAPGFVWRLQTEAGNATAVQAFGWDVHDSAGVIVNMSVWQTVEDLAEWVFGPMHREVLRQRGAWFERVAEATTALWWVPSGHLPSTDEAEERVRRLRANGPTPEAFTFRRRYPMPDALDAAESCDGADDWCCPA